LLILASPELSGCSKNEPEDTSFNEANKAFEKQLDGGQRKTAIEELQTETAR
jgi:hypothetical protein